jgi:hypothetical protein
VTAEPVVTRAVVVTVLSAAASVLVTLGAHAAGGWLNDHAGVLASVIVLVAPLVTALWARRHVTPVGSTETNKVVTNHA